MTRLVAVNIPSRLFCPPIGVCQDAVKIFGIPPGENASIGNVISSLLPNVLILAGIIFFALILIGGIGMIVGAGREANPQSAAKSKAAVTYGLVGFLLVIGAFFILQILGVITGVNFINSGI